MKTLKFILFDIFVFALCSSTTKSKDIANEVSFASELVAHVEVGKEMCFPQKILLG